MKPNSKFSNLELVVLTLFMFLLLPFAAKGQGTSPQQANKDDSDARPPVTAADLQIVKRAQEILDSPAKWNRADNRQCPAGMKTFSLY